jgi:hypothetical protein
MELAEKRNVWCFKPSAKTTLRFPRLLHDGMREKHNFTHLGTKLRPVVNTTHRTLYARERIPVHAEQEAVWAPDTIWKFWRRVKSPAPCRYPNPGPSSTQPHQYNSTVGTHVNPNSIQNFKELKYSVSPLAVHRYHPELRLLIIF